MLFQKDSMAAAGPGVEKILGPARGQLFPWLPRAISSLWGWQDLPVSLSRALRSAGRAGWLRTQCSGNTVSTLQTASPAKLSLGQVPCPPLPRASHTPGHDLDS